MPNMYSYVFDSNSEIDPFGLSCTTPKVKFNPDKKFLYSRGGKMSVISHILKRHRKSTLYDEVSEFGTDSIKKIKKLIKEAVDSGEIDRATNSITKTFTKDIGSNTDGIVTKTIKVFFDDKGWVRTAFPI